MFAEQPHPDLVSAERLINESGCLIQRHYEAAPVQLTEAFDHLEEAKRILCTTFAANSLSE